MTTTSPTCSPRPRTGPDPAPVPRPTPELARYDQIHPERTGVRAPATPPAPPGTALAVLAGVLDRDGQQRSATQTRHQALADADHLPLLHASWTAETTPARDQRYRDLLMSILPAADRREPSHRCLRRSGAPGTVGGRRCCRGPAPDPARCLPWGHLVAGLLQQHARIEAGSKEISYVLSREHHLAGRAAVSAVFGLCRDQSRPAGRSSFSYRPAGRPPCREPAGWPGGQRG